MTHANSYKIKIILTALVVTLMFGAALIGTQASSQTPGKPSLNDPHLILLRRGVIDTRAHRKSDSSFEDSLALEKTLAPQSLEAKTQMRLVQFAEAVKPEWLEQLKATGAAIVAYVPNNTFLIRGDAGQLARVAQLEAQGKVSETQPIRWMSHLQPLQKIAPELDAALSGDGNQYVAVDIELCDAPETASAIEYLKTMARQTDSA